MSNTPSRDVDSRASMDQERHAPAVPEQTLKSSRLSRNEQKWESLKNEIHRVYKVDGQSLVTTMRIIKKNHDGFKASPRKWKMQLKAWSFDKNVSAADMGIVVAKAEKRGREGKDTIFFHGSDEIPPERIENFKRRKKTRIADAPSPSAATPANITYHTPKPVLDEPNVEHPVWDVAPFAEEPIIFEPEGSEIPTALSIEVATATPAIPHQHSHPSPNPNNKDSSVTFDSLEADLQDEGLALADSVGSQLDSLSLKESQPPVPARLPVRNPWKKPWETAPYQLVPDAAALGKSIIEQYNQVNSSKDCSDNYLALSGVVRGLYPYAQDEMGYIVRVSRVEKIIVKLLHEVNHGLSLEDAIDKLRTHPEPFPIGNEPFPEGNDHWTYFHTVLLELARLYENQGGFLDAISCLLFLQSSCGPHALRYPNLSGFRRLSDYYLSHILWKIKKIERLTDVLLPSISVAASIERTIRQTVKYAIQAGAGNRPSLDFEAKVPSIELGLESLGDKVEPVRQITVKNTQQLRETIGDWVLPNDDDGFSSGWTTSSRTYKYGVTYSESDVTGVSNSVYMVP